MSQPPFEKEHISIKENNGIGSIVFSSPKGNSLSSGMLQAIIQALHQLTLSTTCHVIHLTSTGDSTFCAGANLEELQTLSTVKEATHFFSCFAELFLTMKKLPKLIVTTVQGKAVGGGVGLIAASDYAIASNTISIRLSEYSLGFGPFVIGPVLERKIGVGAFQSLVLDGNWRDAEWAKHHHLVDQIVSVDALANLQSKIFEEFARRSLTATKEVKSMLWNDTESWDQLLLQRAKISAQLWIEKKQRKA